MPEREKVKILWDQVRNEPDLTKAVRMIAILTEQAINERMSETTEIRALIKQMDADNCTNFKDIRKILFGNGEPSHSVIARLERIEEVQKRAADRANRVLWIVITAVITQIVLYLLNVL